MNDIVYIMDKGYILPTIVSIQSIADSLSDSASIYNIYCIHNGLSLNDEKVLLGMQNPNVNIILLNKHDLNLISDERLKEYSCDSTATPIALLKFDLANIFHDKDMILYLDGDTVIKKNLDSLFEFPLSNNYAAVVIDKISYQFDTEYFNSGVMLLNLKKMREKNVCDLLYEKKSLETTASLMDQDVLNQVFYPDIAILPLKYNCPYHHLYLSSFLKLKRVPLHEINKQYNENYLNWEALYNDAVIIHYLGKDKPWKIKGTIGGELWDSKFEETLLAKQNLKRKYINYLHYCQMSQHKFLKLPTMFLKDCKVEGVFTAFYNYMKQIFHGRNISNE